MRGGLEGWAARTRSVAPHSRVTRVSRMAQAASEKVDTAQVKKAVRALLAYKKNKGDGDSLLLNEHENILLMVTVWKIPEREQFIRIGLPHGIRAETAEVCLFTKDEPNMTAEQTEAFYKKLLNQHGLKRITQIIPYKALKTEYKPVEAKRRLLSNYDLFLADDRIRRLLPSHIGKHFYKSKRAPLSVNLKAKNLAQVLNKAIQGTALPVTNKGCCYSVRVGHTGMKTDELVENINTATSVIGEKLPKKWKNVKILHLKTQTSASLPIFTSRVSNVDDLDTLAAIAVKEQKPVKKRKGKKRQRTPPTEVPEAIPVQSEETEMNDAPAPIKAKKELKRNIRTSATQGQIPSEDEDIPQLVPIANAKVRKSKGPEGCELKTTPAKQSQAESKVKTPISKKKKAIVQGTPNPKRKGSDKGLELTTPSKQKKTKTMKQASKENVSH